MNYRDLNGSTLAYLGDAVFELIARKRLVDSGITDIGKLNEMARKYVTATAQSDALDRILPVLTEQEDSAYKLGRNTHTTTVPKSAKAGQYRRATGFEALFAYLYLNGENDRLLELFNLAFPEDEGNEG